MWLELYHKSIITLQVIHKTADKKNNKAVINIVLYCIELWH